MTNDLSLSRLRQLLSQRESIRLEFKEARTALPDRLFETICAMLNHRNSILHSFCFRRSTLWTGR